MFIALIGLIYLVCSVASAGLYFADCQGRVPSGARERRRDDLGFAIVTGLFLGLIGPVGVLQAYLMSGFAEHGWRLWWKSDVQ